jgi:hypothetical protein
MDIFNVKIFGGDIEWFCNLAKENQKQWILDNTNQKNEVLIDDFLNAPFNTKNSGCGCCGQLNDKIENPFKNGNISKTISNEVTESSEVISTSGNGKRRASKRRNDDKTA